MINRETIQRIMDATHIEEVVGDFVQLKKRGVNYIACCPFHNEKTPSFNVNPARGIFKCFGCGKGGDSVRFLMEHEHISYPEALRWLANKYNIPIEEEPLNADERHQRSERDALYNLSEFAQHYFNDILFNDEDGRAIGLSYFHYRGLTDDIINRFGLGYCLDQWEAFTRHAKANGYSDKVLADTGLTIFKDDGKCYDRFRGRVMFPIYTLSGRVQGFSGRILTNDKTKAKYVNSPESEIYLKKDSLYGLYQAKTAIVRHDKCYLVEGNLDVIAMHQSGVENTVASCGTSLTAQQAHLIRRFSPNVTVVYDGDAAGIKATLRATDILLEEGLHVRMVLFPDGDDPDSYARKHGSTALQQYLTDQEENLVLYKTRILAKDIGNDPIRKAQVLTDIVQTIALVPDLMERSEYVRQCSSILRMPELTLQQELAKAIAQRGRRQAQEEQRELEQREQQLQSLHHPAASSPGLPTNNAVSTTPNTRPADPNQDPIPDDAFFASQPITAPTTTATDPITAAFNKSVFPDEVQERKIISLLVNNGDTTIDYKAPSNTAPSEDSNVEAEKYYVAAIIVSELADDQISFDNPTYGAIFDLYVKALKQGTIPSANDLVTHPDATIRTTVTDLLIDIPQISPEWKQRDIYVPNPADHVGDDVLYAIRMFKLRKLDRLINDNSRQIKVAATDDDLRILVKEKCRLIRLRQELCAALNCIIR